MALFVSLVLSTSQTWAGGANFNNGSGGNGDRNVPIPTAKAATVPQATSKNVGMQDSAKKGKSSQNTGMIAAVAAMGVCAIGIVATCHTASAFTTTCKVFIGGAIASVVAMVAMGVAGGKSESSRKAVTTGGGDGANKFDADKMLNKEPNFKRLKVEFAKLEKDGFKFKEKEGKWYDPKEKKWFSSDDFKSPAAMAKAGMSKKDIDTANAAIAQINKDVDAKMATADGQAGSDLTVAGKGGGSGGGGTSETSSGAEPPQPSLGVAVDRDQSQVAGMAKSYQGEMIGVSGDSLFQMMDRRYKLHSDRGNFIGGNAPEPVQQSGK